LKSATSVQSACREPDQPVRPTPPPAPASLSSRVPAPRPVGLRPELQTEIAPGVLAAALEGIPVFPIPLGSRQFEIKRSLWSANTEIAAIRQMTADYPECAFGMAMGDRVFAVRLDGKFGVEKFNSMARCAALTTKDDGDWTTRFLHGANTTWALYLSPGFPERRPRPSIGEGISIVSAGGWIPAPDGFYRYLNPELKIAEEPKFIAGLAFEVPDPDEEILRVPEFPSWLPR